MNSVVEHPEYESLTAELGKLVYHEAKIMERKQVVSRRLAEIEAEIANQPKVETDVEPGKSDD